MGADRVALNKKPESQLVYSLMTDVTGFSYVPSLCQVLFREQVNKIIQCSLK